MIDQGIALLNLFIPRYKQGTDGIAVFQQTHAVVEFPGRAAISDGGNSA
jgi:hypothetical protein